jgi:hypothetical protein
MEPAAFIAFALVFLVAIACAMTREDAKLRRRARRYRQLELEGIEAIPRHDPYPEERSVEGGFLREPDGRPADTRSVLQEELERAREHTRREADSRRRTVGLRRGKGTECLL